MLGHLIAGRNSACSAAEQSAAAAAELLWTITEPLPVLALGAVYQSDRGFLFRSLRNVVPAYNSPQRLLEDSHGTTYHNHD